MYPIVTGLRLNGLQEALDRMAGLERAYQQAVIDEFRNWAELVTARMQANHDNDAHDIQRYINRSWYLTRSIGYTIEPWRQGKASLILFATAPYAQAVEEGIPGRSRPYPFFWKEVYGHQDALIDNLRQAAAEAVHRYEDRR
jgi:hypothetical protein